MNFTLSGQQTITPGAIVMPGPVLGGQLLRIGETVLAAFDPSVSGLKRPAGAILYAANGSRAYVKAGSGDTAWSLVGGAGVPMSLTLADATTNTAPDVLILRHTSSGTAAAGSGLTSAVELQSAAGTVRRVATDVTTLTVATDGAEEAQRIFSLIAAGALTKVGGWGLQNGGTAPMLFVGDPGNQCGMRWEAGNLLRVMCAGTVQLGFTGGVATLAANLVCSGTARFNGNFGFGVAPVAASLITALTNNATVGGTSDTIANYTDLAVYANDAAAIRNDIYQLGRKLSQVISALKANGVVV